MMENFFINSFIFFHVQNLPPTASSRRLAIKNGIALRYPTSTFCINFFKTDSHFLL